MADLTTLLIDISNLPEEAGPELARDLTAWLRDQPGLAGEPVIQTGSQDPAYVFLVVTLRNGSGLARFVGTLLDWGVARQPGRDITFKFTIADQTVTAELRSGASDAEIAEIELVVVAAVIAAVGTSTNAGDSSPLRPRWSASEMGLFEDDTAESTTTELALLRNSFLGGFASLQRRSTSPVGAADASTMPVTIYLSDEAIHERVETAVEALLATAGLQIQSRDDPITGSWFRRMRATAKEAARSPAAREATLVAAHMADTRLVLAQDAAVTATLLQNLGPVLGALQPTKDAVIRAGALLIVKVDWTVHVFQLTAAQQAMLDHPAFQLDRSPREIITALNLTPEDHQSESHPELT